MSFRLTGISTLLKRHGRNLTLSRDADTIYDTENSETYKTVNGWNETTINLEYTQQLGRLAYVNAQGIRSGTITREFFAGHTLHVAYAIDAGNGLVFSMMIQSASLVTPPLYMYINGQRVLLTNHYYSPPDGSTIAIYEFPFPDTLSRISITFEQPQWEVRGYFYDSKEINILDTEVGEGNRRVVLYPIDTSGNPLPFPRIGDTIRGQNDLVSVFRVEPVMSNEKILFYLCRVRE